MEIELEKINIRKNCVNNSNDKNKKNIIKLLNRSISENILRYLLINYPNHFRKIKLNYNIYKNIEDTFKDKNQDLLNRLNSQNKNIINEFLDKMKINESQNIEENEKTDEDEETNDTEEQNNFVIFDQEIKVKSKTISANDLNEILNYLFYIKEIGNFSAYPKYDK